VPWVTRLRSRVAGRHLVLSGRRADGDEGLLTETALLLAQESLDHLRAMRELDAPELARRLMADHDTTGATAANMVATAAVKFCRAYGVQL